MNRNLLVLISCCLLGAAAFYALRQPDTRNQQAAENRASVSEETYRPATRRSHDGEESPRSAVSRKLSTVKRPSAKGNDEWITLPRSEFIELHQRKQGYDIRLHPSRSSFDSKLLDAFGASEEARSSLNLALQEFGKKVYELRDNHAQYTEGKHEDEVIVEFDDFDPLLAPHQASLKASIRNALGKDRADLFYEVAKLDEFFDDSEKVFSKGRIRLQREVREVSKNGGQAEKKITFWRWRDEWDPDRQLWMTTGGSGSEAPPAAYEKIFTDAGLYPWPEQGVGLDPGGN